MAELFYRFSACSSRAEATLVIEPGRGPSKSQLGFDFNLEKQFVSSRLTDALARIPSNACCCQA